MTELLPPSLFNYRQTRIGVLGGGQLGRMIALAGYPLGLEFRFLDPAGMESPAGQLAPCVTAAYDDTGAVSRFADGLDAITYEFENVPAASLDALSGAAPVLPPRSALAVAQDRFLEKQCFQELGIATPKFVAVAMRAELDGALGFLGTPSILKTRHLGYDGRGQATLRHKSEAASAWEAVGEQPSILEQRVDFDEEVSIIAVRSRQGAIQYYPLAHNTHKEGILRVSWTDPTETSDAEARLTGQARQAISKILERFDYVGVLALELFVQQGKIIANEIAPRVHNSGHWSIEGAPCSQFENHLRALLDLPLGETHGNRPVAMVNLIGALPNPAEVLRAVPEARIHFYGKAPRPNRKVGHITVLADNRDELSAKVDALQQLIGDNQNGPVHE